MNLIERAIRAVSSVVMALAAVALILMMLMVTLDVVGKYIFTAPVPVTLEMVSNYYMVAVVFLPMAAVELWSGHIHVELIHARLPRVGRRILDVTAHALAFLFFAMLTVFGWEVAMEKFEVGEYLMGQYSLVIWPSRFLVPLGCGLIAALLILKTVRSAIQLARPDLDPDDQPSAHGATE